MRRFAVVILCLVMVSNGLWAKNGAQGGTQLAPQTARQALMEMFFSKEPGTFLKHLPAATRDTLEKSGALAGLQQYSMLTGQFQSQGKSLRTFEAGPVMLATEDPKTGQKFEVVIDNDSLTGEQDDIEVSFHSYKNGQLQKTPFMPRVVFSMKVESGLWRLNDIAISVNLPLADPDFLKSISDTIKAGAAAASPHLTVHPQGQTSASLFGNNANTLDDVRTILAAETTYAVTFPTVGYTCTLSDLDGFGSGEVNEHQAMLIGSGLASGKHQGYNFSLSGCTGTPSASFRLTAAPIGQSYGRRAYCADQSGAIRSAADGSAATCLSSGMPLQ